MFSSRPRQTNRINDKKRPLQVISPLRKVNHVSWKRTLLPASPILYQQEAGSLTIEAALCLTLFLFMTVLLMLPMKIMNTERRMQAALEAVGEEMAQYAYIKDRTDRRIGKEGSQKTENQDTEGWEEYISLAAECLAEKGAEAYVAGRIRDKIDTDLIKDISAGKSMILKNGCDIDLIVEYRIMLPFPVFRIDSLKRQARCCRRAWTGKEGGKGRGDGEKGQDDIVYIGRYSERYHKNRTCHYLYNDISQTALAKVTDMRNSDGKRYHPCKVCGKSVKDGMVYIMPRGESYHGNRGCSAIIAYVEAVPLKSVEHLGPCSYCSGGG